VTRAKTQGERYALKLGERFGNRALILSSPLVEIEPISVEVDLNRVAALLFTSSNAVRIFSGLSARRDIPCFCVGDKTAAVAGEAGFRATSAAGTVGDLEKLVATQLAPNAGVCLHVRGRHVSGNIAVGLSERGYETRESVVYDQRHVPLNDEARRALGGSRPVVVPLFSPRTAQLFAKDIKNLPLKAVSVVCISQAVADKLRETELCNIRIARTPSATAVTREIDAIL